MANDSMTPEFGDTPQNLESTLEEVQSTEQSLLKELRHARRKQRQNPPNIRQKPALSFGQQLADKFAATMGSWRFILIQSALLAIWVGLNITAWIQSWDPYPFILLNLLLSFQAAYAAPIIMMSQNRQQDIDREAAENDYKINVKAELEIELLHHKLDQLRDQEILALTDAVGKLTELLLQQSETNQKNKPKPALEP